MQRDVVELVMRKVAEREKNVLVLSAAVPFDSLVRSKKDFIRNSKIVLQDISSIFLKRFCEHDTSDEWTSWLLEAFTYNCEVELFCSIALECFIPAKLLLKWPVKLFREDGRRYIMFKGSVITYAKVMDAPLDSIILLKERQRVTFLAAEAIEKKRILLSERG